jgi:hypothetical protein
LFWFRRGNSRNGTISPEKESRHKARSTHLFSGPVAFDEIPDALPTAGTDLRVFLTFYFSQIFTFTDKFFLSVSTFVADLREVKTQKKNFSPPLQCRLSVALSRRFFRLFSSLLSFDFLLHFAHFRLGAVPLIHLRVKFSWRRSLVALVSLTKESRKLLVCRLLPPREPN